MAGKNIVRKKPVKKRVGTTRHESRALAVRHRISTQVETYLSRRPHRSFRRTKRRDYVRSLRLPGYWAFNAYVLSVLASNKRLFLCLAIFYGVAGALVVGLTSQDAYIQLSELFDLADPESFEAGLGVFGQAGLLLFSGFTSSLTPQLTDAQQIYSILILLLTWLTSVWLLRSIVAGKHPKLRDGLYNAGAPIVATAMVLIILVLQMLPAIAAVIVFNGMAATSLFETGMIAMLVTLVAMLLVILSMYWAVSTVIAMVIVTLPGMYPWQAIRASGDLVVGRRVRLLLRIVWLAAVNAVAWVLVVFPVVVVDRAIKKAVPFTEVIPVIPITIALVSSVIVVWSAAYVYLLYRKVVEDDASPA